MNKNRGTTVGITLIITILMSILTTGMAFASEGNEVEVVGTIVAIYPDDFNLEIEVDNEGTLEVYLVQVGQNFNFDAVVLGDLIEVKGTLNDEGVLVLTELKIQERARDRVKLQDGEGDAYFCADLKKHPIAEKIAVTYGVDYEIILGYLCADTPVPLGQIMLALQTAALTGEDYTTYLDGFEKISWGQIWQAIDGVKGKPDKGNAPGQIQDKQGEGNSEGSSGKGNK